MSDTPERPVDYKPEEGAEVRPTPRYNVGPGGYETLTRDVSASEKPYQSLSPLAVVALVLAVGYSCVVAFGGFAAFWLSEQRWVLGLGLILVPLLSIPVALKFNIREKTGLLRFAGLALVGFFAGPIGIIGLIAFPSQTPYLLPLWTLFLPLAALALGVAARWGIQVSEGTLSGKPLTTWAIGLSLFFALCYTAFYAATYAAVRQQSVQFADAWIDSLLKDEVERAFVMTIPPQERTSDSMTHEQIESYNIQHVAQQSSPGAYALFAQKPCVRLLSRSAAAKVELVNVRDWGYEAGGYKVQLSYQVTSPYWSFPLNLIVFGADAKGDVKGRRWHVVQESPALSKFDVQTEVQQTAAGNKLTSTLAPLGQQVAIAWTNKLSNNAFEALDEMLTGDEKKEGMVRAYCAPAGVGPGLRAWQFQSSFIRGELVKVDPEVFWAHKPYRQQLIETVRRIFGPHNPITQNPFRVREVQRTIPSWTEANDRLVFRYDVEIQMMIPVPTRSADGKEKIEARPANVEGWLFVSYPADTWPTGKPKEWRIERLELLRGRRLDDQRSGPGNQGGPGGQGRPR